MPEQFSESERLNIVQQARSKSLNNVSCPRRGCSGRVFPSNVVSIDPDNGTKGARYDPFDTGFPGRQDVQRADVECELCGYGAAQLIFTEE